VKGVGNTSGSKFPLIQLPKKFKGEYIEKLPNGEYMFPLIQLPKKFKGIYNEGYPATLSSFH